MYRGKFRKKKNFVQFVQNTKICSKANLSTFEQIFALLNKENFAFEQRNALYFKNLPKTEEKNFST